MFYLTNESTREPLVKAKLCTAYRQLLGQWGVHIRRLRWLSDMGTALIFISSGQRTAARRFDVADETIAKDVLSFTKFD